MKSYEYIKQLATSEYQDKELEVPTIELIEDWVDLINGLRTMLNMSYTYIKSKNKKTMQGLNYAGTNIQFATAQIIATYNAYYDLKNKIEQHNEQVKRKA